MQAKGARNTAGSGSEAAVFGWGEVPKEESSTDKVNGSWGTGVLVA